MAYKLVTFIHALNGSTIKPYTELSDKQLEALCPPAFSLAELKQKLQRGEWVISQETAPRATHFSSAPPLKVPDSAADYQPEPVVKPPVVVPQPAYHYRFEILARPDIVQHFIQPGDFYLAAKGDEPRQSATIKASDNGTSYFTLKTLTAEPRNLQQRFTHQYSGYIIPGVTLTPLDSPPPINEVFAFIRPMVERNGRLVRPTGGFYYLETQSVKGKELWEFHIDDKLHSGFFRQTHSRIINGSWHSDTGPRQPKLTDVMLIYVKVKGQPVGRHRLFYRPTPISHQHDLDTDEGAVIETAEVLAITGQPLATQHDPSLPAVAPGLYNRFYNSRYQAEPINRSRAKYLPITLSDETLYDSIAIINVANCDTPWIELDIEGAGGADFQVVPADQSLIRHDPVGIAGTKMVYKYQPVTGQLDADGKARVELPDEFADKPLQIIINLPQDWSQIWMNLFAGLQLLGGAATLSVACAMEVGTMGVSTLVSLALVAWSADQMYAGANTLLTQQQTGTQAAALFEWAGMPPEYSELAAGMLPISVAMVKGVATSVVNNPALRSVTIHAVRHGDKLVNRSITFIGQKIKHRYVFRRKAGQQPAVANTLEETASIKSGEYLNDFKASPTPLELIELQAGSINKPFININHILNGEIKTYANGTKVGTGGHYLKDPNIKVDQWTGAPDVNGVSKGHISVRDPSTGQWVRKQAETTFFPEHWSKRQTEMEIKSAFENSKPHPKYKEMWTGKTSSGIKIEGYYKKPDGAGATAWPVYKGK